MKRPRPPSAVRGYVLIVCMLLLLGVSAAAIAMLRTSTLQERVAANTREKQRAFEAAQAALRYGERWLDASGGGVAAPCAGTRPAAALQACSNPLGPGSCLATAAGARQDPAAWPARFEFTPAALAVDAQAGLAFNGDINYSAPPGLYIEDAGPSPDGAGELFCIAAYAYGGAAGTLSVVRSIYLVPVAASTDPAAPTRESP